MESYKLFLIIPPGLEDLALREVELKCPVKDIVKIKGGLELAADIKWIETAHTLLKIPTRILMRITEFKVRDFPKLHQKFASFKWKEYLSHPTPNWEISCSKSRLNHTGRIEETIQSALAKALVKQPLNRDWEKKDYPPQTFYVRIVDDNLTLSVDLSGEPLYKRGLQKIKGEAPLRENFAAAFLYELFDGIEECVTLIDPMCGSGTFLTEALTFYTALHLRPFAFETQPFYKGKILKTKSNDQSFPIRSAEGFDTNSDLLAKLHGSTLPINYTAMDSLSAPLPQKGDVLMICNPPYGERLKIAGKRGSFLKEAWKKFIEVDKPLRFGWVLPSDMDDLFNKPKGYTLRKKRTLRNGGLAVTYWIWEKIIPV